MQKIHFEIVINADRQKVWDTMLADATYREWTKAFEPGSHYVGSWEEGTEIRFLAADDKNGMYSRIKKCRKTEFLSIEHLGMIRDGVFDTTSEEVKKWTPAYENYTFEAVEGGTRLLVDMDSNEEYKEMFEQMWPKALQILKELAE